MYPRSVNLHDPGTVRVSEAVKPLLWEVVGTCVTHDGS